jgi:hypothetical protein
MSYSNNRAALLAFYRPKQKRRKPYGPIVIRDGRAWLNVVDGRASSRQPPPAPRGRFPKPMPCVVCGAIFEAQSGGAAYCSTECHRHKLAERRIEEELAEARARRRFARGRSAP